MPSNAKNLSELLNNESTIAVGDVADGSITTAKLAADAVTAAKLADNAVVTASVADGAVTQVKTTGVGKNKNMIINGAMQIHQRAATNVHNDSAVDRYTLIKNNLDTADFSTKHQVITDNPPFSDALEIKCTTADTSIGANELIRIRMRLEANTLQRLQYGSSSARSSKLSFWVKSNLTDTFSVGLTTQDGTSQNIGFTYTIAQANTWQKVTLTVPANPNGTINNDNGNGMMLVWGLTVGSNFRGTANTTWANNTDARNLTGHTANIASSTNNNFYLTGVQWELGDEASDFEHRFLAEELSLCHRYYYEISSNTHDGYEYPMFAAHAWNSSAINVCIKLPVVMRTSPTLTFNNGSGWWRFYRNNGNDPFDTMQADGSGSHSIDMQSNGGISATQGDAGRLQIRMGGGANAAIKCSAEL